MNDDINDYVPSILNPRCKRKNSANITLTQNSVVSRCSLSLRRSSGVKFTPNKAKKLPLQPNKENCPNSINTTNIPKTSQPAFKDTVIHEQDSIDFSAIKDLVQKTGESSESSQFNFDESFLNNNKNIDKDSVVTVSSDTDLVKLETSAETINYNVDDAIEKPVYNISFGFTDCNQVDVSGKNVNIKHISLARINNNLTSVECDIVEDSNQTAASSSTDNMSQKVSPPKRPGVVAVNLEIKKKKLTGNDTDKSKVLFLNTADVEKVSHVIVQPPNYKSVNKVIDKSRGSGYRHSVSTNNGRKFPGRSSDGLIQTRLNSYTAKDPNVDSLLDTSVRTLENVSYDGSGRVCGVIRHEGQEMSKNLGYSDGWKCDRVRRSSYHTPRKDNESLSPRSARGNLPSHLSSPSSLRKHDKHLSLDGLRGSSARSPKSMSPRKNGEVMQFPLASAKSTVKPATTKTMPHFKVVTGTHFAVDAFSYGDIPNVKHYFLTHFHSDHYAGLKKGFNKLLYCSKITADLCVSRLGVNAKYINIINVDETKHLDGIDVTAVDANHCPGALMLIFSLPNGKTILHTGDFRANPTMESYPILWNKDIHTVYLDTTYCNPRYDFPTQEESLEMALYLLRQKKMALEKACKKFSSVLIVCGTYTIGKEKFFLGMARRIGCSVWACPEKDRVLQAVEGRSFSHATPQSCQLHVVPMRDLNVEKLRQYLESMHGAFSEVVAFKPSGWENGKDSVVEGENVTIHGIPYSEHSSFSEMIRFIKFLKPKQVVPTVDISGGVKAVQKFFPCPLLYKDSGGASQSRVTDYFSIQGKPQLTAVT